MTDDLERKIRDATLGLEQALAAADRAAETRDELIREAIREGRPVTTIMTWAGVSRARVYQIRDGRN